LAHKNSGKLKVESGKLIVPIGEHIAESLLLEAPGQSLIIELEAGATADLVLFCTGGEHSVEVNLTGPHARFDLWGLYMVAGQDKADISVRINHLAPDCRSSQLIKGIAAGEATGAFTGMIHVARDAQRTDATLQNRNLQLDDAARVYTRPQLEIYADDVKCGHGATVGQMDEEAIYYMRQRGVGERTARRMQLQGFVDDIINRCPTSSSRELFAAKADKIMECI
jgi:Fe-S cluster assembly protein SufD